MSGSASKTYHIVVRNNRGKVLEERDVVRNSQWSAHGAARNIFREYPAGSHLELSLGSKIIEEFTMHGDGWTFEVKNGESVTAASRAGRALPAQRRGSQPSKATKVKAGRNVKKAVRAATSPKAARAAKAAASAAAPF